MAWAKLDNPKPSNNSLRPTLVRVKARRGTGPASKSRYGVIRIGSSLADRARFLKDSHHCHVMLGSAADAGKLAVSLDDTTGKFKAKRMADGSYQVTIKETSAAGKFSLTFPPFERAGSVQTPPGCPPIIVFEVTPDFLNY